MSSHLLNGILHRQKHKVKLSDCRQPLMHIVNPLGKLHVHCSIMNIACIDVGGRVSYPKYAEWESVWGEGKEGGSG